MYGCAWPLCQPALFAVRVGADLSLASASSHVIGWSWVLLGPTQGHSWFLLSAGATGADFTEWHTDSQRNPIPLPGTSGTSVLESYSLHLQVYSETRSGLGWGVGCVVV